MILVALAADMELGMFADLLDPDKSRIIGRCARRKDARAVGADTRRRWAQGDKQCPEDYQRFDVNVYSQNQMEADLISRQIFRAMRRQGQQTLMQDFDGVIYETDVISVDAEGGPFQLVDTDRRTPFVFRSLCNVLRGGFVDGR